jgi:hypothetical protein
MGRLPRVCLQAWGVNLQTAFGRFFCVRAFL